MIERHRSPKKQSSPKLRNSASNRLASIWLIATLIGNCMPMVEINLAEEES
jgi:hypothetical protein